MTDGIWVTWTEGSGAIWHNVWRGTTTTRSNAERIRIGASVSYFDNDSALVDGRSYYYWIEATNSAGSTFSASYATGKKAKAPETPSAPSAPTSISATTTMTNGIWVTWTEGSGATSHNVWRGTTTTRGNAERIKTGATSSYSDNDSALVAGTPYYYWIEATNAVGSTFSTSYAKGEKALAAWKYTISNGTATVTRGPTNGAVTIPSMLGGYPVTSIGSEAFSGRTGVTAVTIPDSVTNIGYAAFRNCTGLTTVTIPESVVDIGQGAFIYCAGLTNVSIGRGMMNIGQSAFEMCTGLTAVAIPDNVVNIDNSAFSRCSNLTSVAIGNGVKSIGSWAFSESGLLNVTVPAGVTNIGVGAWETCDKLKTIDVVDQNKCYASEDGVLFSKKKDLLVSYPGGRKGAYAIPAGVTEIGQRAFRECNGLTAVTIPDSVEAIGKYVFKDCSNLVSVSIGNNVKTIGFHAFSGCVELTNLSLPSSVTNIGYGAFFRCESLTEMAIPFGVSDIAMDTFEICVDLESVLIPNSVTDISAYAFSRCYTLTEVAIPDSVERIQYYAFSYCSNLTSVTIGNGVTNIGEAVFLDCPGLATLFVPVGWKGTDMLAKASVPSTCSIVYYSSETISTQKVMFNANGGACATASKTYLVGRGYTNLPTATRTDHTFNGWYAATNGGTRITSGTTVTTNAERTLFAQWTPNVTAPGLPTNLSATKGLDDGIWVEWTDGAGATAHNVWRGTTTTRDQAKRIGTVESSPYFDTDSALVAGTSYYYWIEATNSAGSTFSTSYATGKKAAPTPITYSVGYALGGGMKGTYAPTNATCGTAFRVSAPTKNGCSFAGWSVSSGLDASTAKWGTGANPSTAISSFGTKCANGTNDVYFLNLRSTAGSVTLMANWSTNSVAQGQPNLAFYRPRTPSPWPAAAFLTKVTNSLEAVEIFSPTEPVCLRFAWLNNGEGDAGAYAISAVLKDATGTGISTQMWYSGGLTVAAGCKSLSWAEIPVPGCGTYTMEVTLNARNVLAESDFGDNTTNLAFTVGAPNLAGYKPKAWPAAIFLTGNPDSTNVTESTRTGETAYLRFCYGNFGKVAMGTHRVSAVVTNTQGQMIAGGSWTNGGLGINGILPGSLEVRVEEEGNYTAVVTLDPDGDIDESDESDNEIRLEFTAATARPANDGYVDAENLGKTVAGAAAGSNAGATWEPGEPKIYGGIYRTNSVWWVWTAPATGVARFDTVGSEFDTVMTVFTNGAPADIATLKAVKSDNDSGGNGTSRVWFNTAAKRTYWIAVAGCSAQDSGTIALNWQQHVKVAFKGNEATSGSMGTLTNEYKTATALPACGFEKTGYECDGWATSATGMVAYALDASPTFTKNTTLYAHWTATTQTVLFDPNGGTCKTSSRTAVVGETYTKLASATREGYKFVGWYDAQEGGNRVRVGDTVPPQAERTLWARWEGLPQTVRFDANGGTCKTSSRTAVVGKTYAKLASATREGYKFVGWYDAQEGGTRVRVGDTVTPQTERTLWARWEGRPQTVHFDANGGKCSKTTATYIVGEIYSGFKTATRNGFKFMGWYDAKDGGKRVKNGMTVTVDSERTLYARWQATAASLSITGFARTPRPVPAVRDARASATECTLQVSAPAGIPCEVQWTPVLGGEWTVLHRWIPAADGESSVPVVLPADSPAGFFRVVGADADE